MVEFWNIFLNNFKSICKCLEVSGTNFGPWMVLFAQNNTVTKIVQGDWYLKEKVSIPSPCTVHETILTKRVRYL